jgi:hypothetical protein
VSSVSSVAANGTRLCDARALLAIAIEQKQGTAAALIEERGRALQALVFT